MKTETLFWVLGGTMVVWLIVPPLFPIILIANTVIILAWLFGSGGGGGSSFDRYDNMGPGDFGGD